MNILTVGLPKPSIHMLDQLCCNSSNHILHIDDRKRALSTLREIRNYWDWIILQGSDNPADWKSILCSINSNAVRSQITVLSHHIDGTRLKTPVCSMHSNKQGKLSVSHCAMQNILQQEHSTIMDDIKTDETSPIVFEYHAPCR